MKELRTQEQIVKEYRAAYDERGKEVTEKFRIPDLSKEWPRPAGKIVTSAYAAKDLAAPLMLQKVSKHIAEVVGQISGLASIEWTKGKGELTLGRVNEPGAAKLPAEKLEAFEQTIFLALRHRPNISWLSWSFGLPYISIKYVA